MSTSATVPIIDPQGKVWDIPYENMHAAISKGGKLGVYMKDPDGQQWVIPSDRVQDAVKKGGSVVPYNLDGTHQNEGFWKAFTKDIGSAVGGFAQMLTSDPTAIAASTPQFGANIAANDIARQARGSGKAYRALAAAGQVLTPANIQGMEEAADVGDTSGVLGHAAAGAAITAAPLIAERGVKGGRVAKNATAAVVKELTDTTSAARSTIPEAANLPDKAISGLEKIYRAAAPVGSDPMFRGNLYKAAGDLAEIGRAARANIANAKGGIVQPDMRVRAVIKAINDHLAEMYKQERAPQISRNADNPIVMELGKDANEGLKFLSRNAGMEADRALASKAMSSDHLTLAETDQLAKLVNKELAGFESMTPAERAAASQVNRRAAGLKALDRSLGDKIGAELERRGEPGIKEYEGRYAALSAVRDQLQSRMNAVELNQRGPIKTVAQPIARLVSGGKSGVVSASQAAVADVNIGRTLQQGFRNLADTSLSANRGMSHPEGPELVPSRNPYTGRVKYVPKRNRTTLESLLGLERK